MNTTTNDKKMQSETTNTAKLSRAEIRRQAKAAAKSKKSNKKKNNAKKQAPSQCNEDVLQKVDDHYAKYSSKT